MAVLEAGQVLLRQKLKLDYYADCAAVVTGFDGGYDRATAPWRAHASIWRMLDAGWGFFEGSTRSKHIRPKWRTPPTGRRSWR